MADVFRLLAMIVGTFCLAATLVVAATYFVLWHRFHRGLPQGVRWRGLLPIHVVLIGISYALLVGITLYEIIIRIREELTWRTPALLVAYSIGFAALWTVLGASRYRFHNTAPTPKPEDADEVP